MPDPLLQAVASKLEASSKRQLWHDRPDLFVAEAFKWGGEVPRKGHPKEGGGVKAAAGYQARALVALQKSAKLAVRSPHGSGKTTVAAWAVLWFSITRELAGEDWKVITTAGSWRQLEKYLWPEIRSWTNRLRWDLIGTAPWISGRDQFDLSIKLRHGQAFAVASDDPQLLEGAHASELLLVIDEAKAVPDQTWNSVEGALSGGGGHAYALAVSTPGPPSGRFYQIHQRQPGLTDWAVQHITLAEAVAAGRISAGWAQARAAQWGEGSAIFANRVLGEFSSSDEDGLIPLQWVEAANARWQAWRDAGAPLPGGRLVIGADIARYGSDATVLVSRRGDYITEIERHTQEDTMQTVGRIMRKLVEPSSVAVIDTIGLGSGVFDRIREQRKTAAIPFASSERSDARDRSGELQFVNRRAESWWHLRELLDLANGATLALPDDDMLVGDLTSPRWSINSSGRIVIESKDEIRKRLGRSPDAADALAMAFSLPATSYTGPLQGAVPYVDRPGPNVVNPSVPWAGGDPEPTPGEMRLAEERWLAGR